MRDVYIFHIHCRLGNFISPLISGKCPEIEHLDSTKFHIFAIDNPLKHGAVIHMPSFTLIC